MPPAQKIYLNGIDATTGQYLVAPMTVNRAVKFAKGENVEPDISQWFSDALRKLSAVHLGIGRGIDEEKLRE